MACWFGVDSPIGEQVFMWLVCLFVFPRVGLLVSLLIVSAVCWLLTMMKNLRWVVLRSLCTKQAEKPMRVFSFATARNDLNGYQMLEMAMKKAHFPFLNIKWKRPAVSLLWQDPLSFLHRLCVYSHTQIDDKKCRFDRHRNLKFIDQILMIHRDWHWLETRKITVMKVDKI